jgi:hypothetical protein
LRRALARARGSSVSQAPEESAPNSRLREMAIWISRAAIGARITVSRAAIGWPPSSSFPPIGMKKAGRAIQVMTTPMVEGLLPST